MTDYHQERAENIRKNQQLLATLGLVSLKAQLKAPKIPAPVVGTKRKREAKPKGPVQLEPTRKSARLSVQDTASSHVVDERAEQSPPSRILSLRILPSAIPQNNGDDSEGEGEEVEHFEQAPPPTRDDLTAGGTIRFEPRWSHFTPNLTPAEVMSLGSFGGTSFKPFYSRVLKRDTPPDFAEFPEEWYTSIDRSTLLTQTEYDPSVNQYKVKAGQSLEDWEKAGWIHPQDPRGWFQWYCRFYCGRRTKDDERQVKRWLGVCGPNGRFKKALVKKIAQSTPTSSGDNNVRTTQSINDTSIAPVLRQTLQHWSYRITTEDYMAYF